MKASNTLVMVQAYRLLVATMRECGMNYPLHLGVTEAGEGEDGRIKSAVGIGALLEDGLGDTIRVSLTEEPEVEIPVAKKLLAKFETGNRLPITLNVNPSDLPYDPYSYTRRISNETGNLGNHHVPVVVADLSTVEFIKPSHFFGFGYNYSVTLDKWNLSDSAADLVYIGKQMLDFEVPGTLTVMVDYDAWHLNYRNKPGYYPLLGIEDLESFDSDDLIFIKHTAENEDVLYLLDYPNAVIVLKTEYSNKTQIFRYSRLNFATNKINNPVILCSSPATEDPEKYQLWSSSDIGSVLIDGFGDGIWLGGKQSLQLINTTSFGILQATRCRISKTEYISCPSCGRTLFDLQETTARIREKTSHLKGLKIGIMGCIVNGPGEMADADYGYVGTGPGKIHLYKEKIVVRKNVPESEAVDALIELIKENDDWVEPK
jgi:(E)-4-hydroxy-3-methylbut-2-enyl-diphosphate synthase